MPHHYDHIVLGVGGFGSSALYHLARRGRRVLGIERFDVPHDRGSSHGETRIIRKAYFEHPDYVPLLVRAYDLWRDLERESGRRLLEICGLVLAGAPESEAIAGVRLAARLHGVAVEDVGREAARRRFSAFQIPDGNDVLFEPDGGYLHVEDCVRTHAKLAIRHGAELRTGEAVRSWQSDGTRVRVVTDRAEYSADSLVITAGAWASQVLAELGLPLTVVRKTLHWHRVRSSSPPEHPTFYFDRPAGSFYGFPCIDGHTVKLAQHSGGEPVADPLAVDRTLRESDAAPIREFVTECMPHLEPQTERHAVCLYTNTPDHHFVIDRHPEFANVVLGAGFSGHGFKFTSVLGDVLADLAVKGQTDLAIGFLGLDRPTLRPA